MNTQQPYQAEVPPLPSSERFDWLDGLSDDILEIACEFLAQAKHDEIAALEYAQAAIEKALYRRVAS